MGRTVRGSSPSPGGAWYRCCAGSGSRASPLPWGKEYEVYGYSSLISRPGFLACPYRKAGELLGYMEGMCA